MQFKLVDKRKYSLIKGLVKDPNFVVKHHEYHSRANNSASLIFYGYVPKSKNSVVYGHSVSLLTLQSNQGKISHTVEDLQLPPFYYHKGLMSGIGLKFSHCDGIVCVVDHYFTVNLCNPALRKCKTVRPKSYLDQMNCAIIEETGFGYDSRSDKYKVIQIYRDFSELKADVYTLGTNSWRKLGIVPNTECRYARLDCPVYYKGCCYWLMLFSEEETSMLLCFDMSSEVFQIVALPNYYDRKMNFIRSRATLRLTMWKGSVCLLCYDSFTRSRVIRMWVMEIKPMDGAPSGYNYRWRECKRIRSVPEMMKAPLTFWKEDELLMSIEEHRIGSFNVRTQKLSMLTILDGVCTLSLCSEPFVASLVSIKTDAKVTADSSTS